MSTTVTINGVTYDNVPRIRVPIYNGGGDLQSFWDCSSDTATAADIAEGKTAHGSSGLIVGTATGGGGSAPVLQEVTVRSNATENQVITPPEGYDGFSKVIVRKRPLTTKTIQPQTTAQTYSANDEEYYGYSSVTVNAMNLQSKQVTPSSVQQVITPDTGYDGLSQVVVDESSGGGDNIEDYLDGTVKNLTINVNKFTGLQNITGTIDITCNTMNDYCFYNCRALNYILRGIQQINSYVLSNTGANLQEYGSSFRSTFIFTDAATFDNFSVYSNAYVGTIYAPKATSIGTRTFGNNYRLHDIYIGKECSLSNVNAFASTPIAMSGSYADDTARIHVPADLEQTFKEATNWSTFESKIVGDYEP